MNYQIVYYFASYIFIAGSIFYFSKFAGRIDFLNH
jgi:hypothetical protein